MRIRVALSASAIALSTAFAPAVAVATPSHAVAVEHHKHKCTKTSTGHCIKGGEFCPKAKYHKSGWDAKGRRYVCKGSKTHPHWEKP